MYDINSYPFWMAHLKEKNPEKYQQVLEFHRLRTQIWDSEVELQEHMKQVLKPRFFTYDTEDGTPTNRGGFK